MVRYGLYEAWIQGPDGAYAEYDVKINGKELVCCIAGQHRAYFQVHWVDHGTGLHTAAWIIVDGRKASGKFIEGSGHKRRSGHRTDTMEEIPFEFTKKHGTIELKLSLVKDGSRRPNDDPKTMYSKRLEALKDNKYGQRVEFKQSAPAQADYTYNVVAPGTPAESCVKFIFHYHPEEWLRRRGILGLPSQPPPEMQRFIMLHSKTKTGSEDTPASVPPVPGVPAPLAISFYQPAQGDFARPPTHAPMLPPAPVPDEQKPDKGKQPARARSRSKRRRNNGLDKSPDVSVKEVMERHRVEFEAEFEKKYGYNPNVPRLALPDSKPLPGNIQQHPRASNTYIIPTQAASSSSTPGPSSRPPPVQFPYLTPSGRPSAIIDTRFFARPVKTESPPGSQ